MIGTVNLLPSQIQNEIRRERAYASVQSALSELPLDERRQVLIRCFASLETATPTPETSVTTTQPEAVPAKVSAPVQNALFVQQPSASEKPSDPNRTQKLIAALKAHPKLPIPEMAKAVYGVNSDPSRNRVRSLLATLQSREIVKRVGPGEWVLDKEA